MKERLVEMKNIFTITLAGAVLACTLGCGLISRMRDDPGAPSNSNKTLGDKAVDVAVGDTKIGIKECDDVVEILDAQINDPDESFVTKAVKRTILNQFRDQLKRSLDENQADKTQVAKFCAEFKKNLIESVSNTNSNGHK